MMNILSSHHHQSNEEEKQQYLDMMFTPYNLLQGDKSRGGNHRNLNHHQTVNNLVGAPMSSDGGSSFSGSGQKNHPGSGGGIGMKSLKSSHTIEKTYSDFFNLTQEESAHQLLIVSGISQ